MFSVLLGVIAPVQTADLRTYDFTQLDAQPYTRIVGRASLHVESRQHDASLAMSGDGFVVAWSDNRRLAGLPGAVLRRFHRFGVPRSGEQVADSDAAFSQSQPSVILGRSGPAVAFTSLYRDGSGSGVFLGGKSAATRIYGHQTDPVAVTSGDFVYAAWVSDVTRDRRVVMFRIFDLNLRPISPELNLSGSMVDSDLIPTIAVSKSRVAVAWHRMSRDGVVKGIFGQTFALDGTPTSEPVCLAVGNNLEPSISICGEGFVVGWNAMEPNGNTKVFARKFNQDFSVASDLFSADDLPGRQNAASVAGRSDGSFVLAWNQTATDGPTVLIKRFSQGGKSRGEPTRVSNSSGRQALAECTGRTRMHYSDDGVITIAWHGDSALGDSFSQNFTILVPNSSAPDSLVGELKEAKEKAIQYIETERAKLADVQLPSFAADATPHEPPTFDPKRRDPWPPIGGAGDGGGFLAITNTGWTPPDPHHGVGPNHIVAMVNGQIAFFTKSGVNLFRQAIEGAQGFWGSLNAGGFVFDPEAMYDPLSQRFFAMACERTGGQSYFLLGVSDDADPEGVWFKYRFNVTALAGGDIDSPNIATDANAVYLTADFFTGGQKYLIYILKKADLIAGSPTPGTTSHLITGTQSHGIPITWDVGAPAQYMIEHFEAATNTTVRLHAITNPLTSPTLTAFTLSVPAYGPPEDPPQSGTTTRPETFDSRFWSCVYRDGYLWATHHVNASQVRARWYQIAMNGWPTSGMFPSLVQSGEIVPAAGVRTFFSSISVDIVGNAAVVCARSSPSEFISMYRAIRRATDPPGTMPDEAIIVASNAGYTTNRWGDYSGCVTDPVDGRTFWGHHEYAISNSWRTWIEPFAAQPNVVTATPSSFAVTAGTHISGGLPQLSASDNSYLVIRATAAFAASEPAARLEVQSTLPTTELLSFKFRFESHVTALPASTVTIRTELWNVTSSTWELVDVRSATNTDSTFDVTPSGDVKRFIDATTKNTRARVSFFDPGALAFVGWLARVDVSVWPIEY